MIAMTLTTGGSVGKFDLVRGKTLEQLQDGVGGLIEAVNISKQITMWVNEEGKFNGSDHNYLATKIWESAYGKTDSIMGDVVFTGGTNKRGSTLGLSAKSTAKIMGILLGKY